MKNPVNQAGILLGSNIDPEKNLVKALLLLEDSFGTLRLSSAWESASVGFDGPNYLNAAVLVETSLEPQTLAEYVLRPLENQLGRRRQPDKFAPRTIDLDIVTWNHAAVADEIWQHAHAAVPTSQIEPELRLPQTGETLAEIARRLRQGVWVRERKDILAPLEINA